MPKIKVRVRPYQDDYYIIEYKKGFFARWKMLKTGCVFLPVFGISYTYIIHTSYKWLLKFAESLSYEKLQEYKYNTLKAYKEAKKQKHEFEKRKKIESDLK